MKLALKILLLTPIVTILNSIIYTYYGIIQDDWLIRLFFRYTPLIMLYTYACLSYIDALNSKNLYSIKTFRYLIIIYIFCTIAELLDNAYYPFTKLLHFIFYIFVYTMLGLNNVYSIFRNKNMRLQFLFGVITLFHLLLIFGTLMLFYVYCQLKDAIFIDIYSIFVLISLLLSLYKLLIANKYEFSLYYIASLLLVVSQYLLCINIFINYYIVIDIISIHLCWISFIILSCATCYLNSSDDYMMII